MILEKNETTAHAHIKVVPFFKLNISPEALIKSGFSQMSLIAQKD
ncbi:MAG: hypothetical protein WCJ92_02760 [Alphaproteobacteria bacterium]